MDINHYNIDGLDVSSDEKEVLHILVTDVDRINSMCDEEGLHKKYVEIIYNMKDQTFGIVNEYTQEEISAPTKSIERLVLDIWTLKNFLMFEG